MNRKWLSLLLVAALLLSVMSMFTTAMAADKPVKIGISLPTLQEERWGLDKQGFESAAAEAGIDILLQVANTDQAVQQSQCENMFTQGIDVLIIGACDEGGAANIVDLAHAEGVKVIAYDRLIADADVDLYATFNQLQIGRLMGEYVAENLESGNIVLLRGDPGDSTCKYLAGGALEAIQAKLDSGAYKIVMEQDCINWENDQALKHVENALSANDNDIQAVIAPNDGTAGAAVQALAAQGLAGKVIVTGQDCETDAIKRIIEGTQSMTVFFDTRDMSAGAFKAAVKMAKGEPVDTYGVENNGFKDVPTIQYPATCITKDNYQLVFDTGYMSEDALK